MERTQDRAVRAVLCDEDADRQRARRLAEHLGVRFILGGPEPASDDLVLRLSVRGLSLEKGSLSLMPDFLHMQARLSPHKLSRELIVRAARIKNAGESPLVIDATGGLGEDALCLASYGYTIHLYEKDPVIAALLLDAISRAMREPGLAAAVRRIHVFEQDSVAAMGQLDCKPDIIYLDPMFPARKKSAAVKKKFQLLHELEQPAQDESELIEAAVAAHPRKIVVKRPAKGPCLGGIEASYSLFGKAVRFDCIVLP